MSTFAFTGRKRVFIVWVQRVTLGEHAWDPIACMTRDEAAGEIKSARRSGYQAFVCAYMKQKRTGNDRRTEKEAQ